MDMSPLEERSDKCSHSPLVRCIELPVEFGIARPTGSHADEDTFLLFLQHLYVSSTLHSPPHMPSVQVRAALTDDTPTCTSFPLTCVSTDELEEYSVRSSSDQAMIVNESLLSLFHYFDCEAALRKCIAVILGPSRSRRCCTWGLFWLPIATRYGMKEVEERCIEDIVKDK